MSSGNEELSPLLTPMGLPLVEAMATNLNKGKWSGLKKKTVKSPELINNSDEEATNVISKDIDMADSTQMGVHTTAIAAQQAIFSLNCINLCTPPLEVKFREWNDRPLKMNWAKDLLATMKSQELWPFLLHNMLPLIYLALMWNLVASPLIFNKYQPLRCLNLRPWVRPRRYYGSLEVNMLNIVIKHLLVIRL